MRNIYKTIETSWREVVVEDAVAQQEQEQEDRQCVGKTKARQHHPRAENQLQNANVLTPAGTYVPPQAEITEINNALEQRNFDPTRRRALIQQLRGARSHQEMQQILGNHSQNTQGTNTPPTVQPQQGRGPVLGGEEVGDNELQGSQIYDFYKNVFKLVQTPEQRVKEMRGRGFLRPDSGPDPGPPLSSEELKRIDQRMKDEGFDDNDRRIYSQMIAAAPTRRDANRIIALTCGISIRYNAYNNQDLIDKAWHYYGADKGLDVGANTWVAMMKDLESSSRTNAESKVAELRRIAKRLLSLPSSKRIKQSRDRVADYYEFCRGIDT